MLVNDDFRMSAIQIGNLAAGGPIGTAAATVDIASVFVVAQSTAGQSVTAPNPTNGNAGLTVVVANRGTTAFTLYGASISVGSHGIIMWDGTAWDITAARPTEWREITVPDVVAASAAQTSSMGTAAATVDVADILRVSQSTSGACLVIPSPTVTTPRQVWVYNAGTVPFAVQQGAYLSPGQAAVFEWSSGAWRGLQAAQGVGMTSTLTGTPAFTFNNGQNVVINGISTIPATAVVYRSFDSNLGVGFGGPLSLPSAVGRTGGLSVEGNAAWPFTLSTRNSNLIAPIGNVNGGRQVHFEAVNGVWEWRPYGVSPAVALAGADFWRSGAAGTTSPDGTSDTTEPISHDGSVVIGGLPVITAPTGAPAANNYFKLETSATESTQIMRGNAPYSYLLRRAVPVVAGGFIDICTLSSSANGSTSHVFRVSVNVSDAAFSTSKTYDVAAAWNATAGVWRLVTPIADGGNFGGNDFQLLVNGSNQNMSLRLRRSGGTTAGTARITIEHRSDQDATITETSATGIDAAAYAPFQTVTTAVASAAAITTLGVGNTSAGSALDLVSITVPTPGTYLVSYMARAEVNAGGSPTWRASCAVTDSANTVLANSETHIGTALFGSNGNGGSAGGVITVVLTSDLTLKLRGWCSAPGTGNFQRFVSDGDGRTTIRYTKIG